jgi:hypothetical protein
MYPKKIGSFLARFIFAVVRYPARAESYCHETINFADLNTYT